MRVVGVDCQANLAGGDAEACEYVGDGGAEVEVSGFGGRTRPVAGADIAGHPDRKA